MKKIFLLVFLLSVLWNCSDNATDSSQINTVKIAVSNAASGSILYYAVCDGSVSTEDIMNNNVEYLILDYVIIDATQKTIEIPASNDSGSFTAETGHSYKIAYFIDLPPLTYDYETQSGYTSGDGGGLLSFTASEGVTTIGLDVSNMDWVIQ